MTDKTSKAVERRIARKLGTVRTPLSGGNGKQTRSDTLHTLFYTEIKHRAKIPFFATWKETVSRVKAENKIPMVVLHQKQSRENIVMMSLDEIEELPGELVKEKVKRVLKDHYNFWYGYKDEGMMEEICTVADNLDIKLD